jgi:enamine deaminase RidA (YjgF/YER057c/UK114 family)
MPHLIFVPAVHAADTSADIARQTTLVLATLDERLRSHRSSLADSVVITVYLRDAADFAAMNDAYRQAWTAAPPTRTTVVTDLFTPGARVEMSAVAVPAGADRRVIHPPGWMASPNPYSYAIRAGDTLFLSGLIPRNGKDNSTVQGKVDLQTHAVMDNAREILEAAGLSLAHLVSARAFLPNLDDFAEFNRIYRECVGADRPARATVGARLTGAAYNVEVTFVASASPRQAIETSAQPNPNLSAAVRAGSSLFVSGLLADAEVLPRDPGAQTRDIIRKLGVVLHKAEFTPRDVRDLLVYVTDDEAHKAAMDVCRDAFATAPSTSPVAARLAAAGARVEIMAYAEKP